MVTQRDRYIHDEEIIRQRSKVFFLVHVFYFFGTTLSCRSPVLRHRGPNRLVQVLFVVSVSGCRKFQPRHRTEAGPLHSGCIPIHALAGSCTIVHRHCVGHRTA